MQDVLHTADNFIAGFRIGEIGVNKFDALTYRGKPLLVSRRQVIDNSHLRAFGDKAGHQMRADETGASRH